LARAGESINPEGPSIDVSSQIRRYGPTLVRVAWLSIGLGLAMEVLLLVLAITLGNAQSVKPFLADLTQKVTWSVIVCVGLAIGKLASKAHLGLAGLLGLITAPLAFEVARSVHKGAAQALSVAIGSPSSALVFAVALNKGLEYGCLGLTIAWAQGRWRIGARGHIAIGLACGVVFGGVTLALTTSGGLALTPAVLLAWAVNELLFPVGCALILYSTDVFGAPPHQADRTE